VVLYVLGSSELLSRRQGLLDRKKLKFCIQEKKEDYQEDRLSNPYSTSYSLAVLKQERGLCVNKEVEAITGLLLTTQLKSSISQKEE
jgi:hypothetical protein